MRIEDVQAGPGAGNMNDLEPTADTADLIKRLRIKAGMWAANPAQVEILREVFGEALQPLYDPPQSVEQQGGEW